MEISGVVGAVVVEAIFGWDSGGGVLLDMLTLSDGSLLVVSDELVAHYANWDAFYTGKSVGSLVLV